MKQYDKIWVPDDSGHYKLQEFYEDHHEYIDCHEGSLGERTGVIVMTMEEVKELWEAGKDRGTEAHSGINSYPNLKTYIQSKGIQLFNDQINKSKG